MTNLEALNAVVGYTSPDANIPIKALLDVSLVPTDAYIIGNSNTIDEAAIAVLMAFKTLAKIDEGGFGITFNHESADKTITFLYNRSGGSGTDPLANNSYPKLSNGSNLW